MALIEPSLLGEFLAIKTLLRSPVPEGNPGVARHAEGMFWTSEASLRAESCGRNKGEGPKAPIRGSPARELRSLELTSEPDLSGESRNYRTASQQSGIEATKEPSGRLLRSSILEENATELELEHGLE